MTVDHRRLLVAILLIAVSLRVALALYWGDAIDVPPLLTDQRSYHALGERLLAGEGFSFGAGWYPFTPPDTPTAHWSFLQSLYIAAIYGVTGAHPLAARLVTAVLGGILLPLAVYALARRWQALRASAFAISNEQLAISDFVPLTAAFLAAVYPYFELYAATLMTETLYIVAVLWSLERALALRETLFTAESAEGHRGGKDRFCEEPGARERVSTQRRKGAEEKKEKTGEDVPQRRYSWLLPALTLGLSLGVAALLRQSILPWVVVLFAWLAGGTLWPLGRGAGRAFMALGAAGLVMMACIVPVTARNYGVYGEFLLLNSNAGYAMYSAQHPLHGTSFQAYTAAPLPSDVEPIPQNEAQWDRVLMARGVQFVLDDPGRYALLSLSRAVDYLEFWPKAESSLLFNVGRVLSFGWLLPVAVAGVWLVIRGEGRTRGEGRGARGEAGARGEGRGANGEGLRSPTALLLLFVATYSLLHILTWAMPRYRLPVDAVLVIFAAVAVVGVGERVVRCWGCGVLGMRG